MALHHFGGRLSVSAARVHALSAREKRACSPRGILAPRVRPPLPCCDLRFVAGIDVSPICACMRFLRTLGLRRYYFSPFFAGTTTKSSAALVTLPSSTSSG